MDTSDVIASASALVAALGLALAYLQFRQARDRAHSEAERLARQGERLRNAAASALANAEVADALVQRAKKADVTVVELQNQARAIRGHLLVLARQLEEEGEQILPAEVTGAFGSRAAAR